MFEFDQYLGFLAFLTLQWKQLSIKEKKLSISL